MEKTIITIYGRKNEGKSETIKNVCKMILLNFPKATKFPNTDIDYHNDILIVIQIGEIKIGIESEGDPESRMLNENESIEDLAKNHKCDIILCASRTSGDTVNRIDKIANQYDYGTIWKSSYYAPNYNYTVINRIAAEEIINLIKSLIVDEI